MKISNIRIEDKDSHSYLKADVDCSFSTSKSLWFSVDSRYKDWLTTDVYDAFLVGMTFPAMYYGEDIEIEGSVNKKIYKNLTEYIVPTIRSIYSDFNYIKVKISGFADTKKSKDKIIGTGFSGGVDSFSTIIDRFKNEIDPEYRINTLFFFNVGQYQNSKKQLDSRKALEYYENSIPLSKELGLPYVFLDTNLFDFYLPKWEYDAGPLCRATSILVFQRSLIRYYVSGSLHYIQQNSFKQKDLDDVTDTFIYYMLSPTGLEIILDGNQYYRSEKIEKIADYDCVRRNLNVCVNNSTNIKIDKNCGKCHKCLRTLLVLEASNKLSQFKQVFNIDEYKKHKSFYNKCRTVVDKQKDRFYANENYKYAIQNGVKMPSLFTAYSYLVITRLFSKVKRYFPK